MEPFIILVIVLGIMGVCTCFSIREKCAKWFQQDAPDLPPKYEILEAPPPYDV